MIDLEAAARLAEQAADDDDLTVSGSWLKQAVSELAAARSGVSAVSPDGEDTP